MKTTHKALPLSSGASLNFEVVSGITEPVNPKENTIWVKTLTEISKWSISKNQPNLPDGGVWIGIENSCDISFNGLKRKNCINICPIRLLQWVAEDDMFKNKNAYIYQNGEWVLFNRETAEYLLENGVLNTDFIGSFNNGLKINVGTGGDRDSGMSASTTSVADRVVDLMECTEIKILGIAKASASSHGSCNSSGTLTLKTSSGTYTLATSYAASGGSSPSSVSNPFEARVPAPFSRTEKLEFTVSFDFKRYSGASNGGVEFEITDIYLVK